MAHDGPDQQPRAGTADASPTSPTVVSSVLTICALTDELRTAAAGVALTDLDHGVQLTYDLMMEQGAIRRRVHDLAGMIEDSLLPMETDCAWCSLRAEIIASVGTWGARRRPIVLALPPTAEPITFVADLRRLAAEHPDLIRVGRVLSMINSESVESDVFGDDLLEERGWALSPDDRRAVGEVLCHQLECADLIAVQGIPSLRASTILDHLTATGVQRAELHRIPRAELLRTPPTETIRTGTDRSDRHPPARSGGAADVAGVWTIELRSDRPFAPDRLRSELEALGGGPLRGRGHFWLPTRPTVRCVWDGAGGQLSIGPAGTWQSRPETALLITGVDADPAAVRAAFDRAVLTDAEFVAGPAAWADVDDGLDPWLGDRSAG